MLKIAPLFLFTDCVKDRLLEITFWNQWLYYLLWYSSYKFIWKKQVSLLKKKKSLATLWLLGDLIPVSLPHCAPGACLLLSWHGMSLTCVFSLVESISAGSPDSISDGRGVRPLQVALSRAAVTASSNKGLHEAEAPPSCSKVGTAVSQEGLCRSL